MVFSCFLCPTRKYVDLDSLLNHYQIVHKSIDIYRCTAPTCLSSFQSFHMFKNHFKNKKNHPSSSVPLTGQFHSTSGSSIHLNNYMTDSPSSSNEKPSEKSKDQESKLSSTNLRETVTDSALRFISKLYSSPTMNRNGVEEVINGFNLLLEDMQIQAVRSKVLEILQENNVPIQEILQVQSYFEAITNPFQDLETDFLRLEALKESNMYIEPNAYVIGSQYVTKQIKENVELTLNNVTGQHFPMKEVLKRVLELPGALDSTLENLKNLQESPKPFVNIVQGEIWQEKIKQFENKTVLPLYVYFDDFEPDNALGSHATEHKIGAVYYSIACFPPECLSSIQNLFLSLLFLSEDKIFTNEKVFKPLIDDLIDLEINGIEVNGQRIYFSLCMILGDNLGMHEILGFIRGFAANYPCRICKIYKNVLHTQTVADKSLFRISRDYFADVLKNNPSETGIEEMCVFNRIPSYADPTKNPHVDLMHDICGVGAYDMGEIFHYIVQRKNYIDLFILNERICNFDYSLTETGNVIPPISEDHLRQKKSSVLQQRC